MGKIVISHVSRIKIQYFKVRVVTIWKKIAFLSQTVMICELKMAYKNEFEGKAQLRRHLRERFTMVEKASGDQQAMTKAHEVEVNKLIDQAVF